MDEIKKKHKNQHEWAWMPEFGGYFYYCGLCHRCRSSDSTDKKYYTHKQALIIVLEEKKNHPANCECILCGKEETEMQEYYKKYYGI